MFYSFGSDDCDIVIDDVDCSTSDYLVLLQCDYDTTTINLEDCSSSNDVGVTCCKLRSEFPIPFSCTHCKLLSMKSKHVNIFEFFCISTTHVYAHRF